MKSAGIIAIVAVAMIGVMVPSIFADIQYDEEQHFRIDLPDDWESKDYSQFYHSFKFSENLEPFPPIIFITYGIDDKIKGGVIKNESWEYQSPCDTKDDFGKVVSLTYHPYGYAEDFKCDGVPIAEIEEWDDDNFHFKKSTEITKWKSVWESGVLTSEVRSTMMHITNGVEFWNVVYHYDLRILNKIPDMDNRLTEIMASFEPSACNENSSLMITLNGERNPVLGETYQYSVVIDSPVESGFTYVVLGQNAFTYKIKNYPNTENSDNGYINLTGNIGLGNFEITYTDFAYNEGESFIKITNDCFQESFPINLWKTQPNLKEEISDVKEIKNIPSWVKNNAKWWAEGQIGDDAFTQGIQFLIKEKIMNVESTSQSSAELKKIPSWVKNNAKWWADGSIDEGSFVAGIEFLVKEGIILVN
jgi:hypothetical protein